MKLEKDDAKIGLLVFLTLALFVGFIFQRSLTRALRKESRVRVRLDNAADLAEGTEVQLQGLRVGQVSALELQREGVQYHFMATLGLRPDIVLWEGTQVLVVSRPLGGAYLELLLPAPAARRAILAPATVLGGTVGPTLATLVDHIDALVVNLDLGVEQVRAQLQTRGLGTVLEHPQVRKVFLDLGAALASFRQLAEDSRGLVRHGDATMAGLDRTLAAVAKSIEQIQALLDSRRGDLDAIVAHLAGTLREMEGLTRELRTVVQEVGPDGDTSLKSLDRTLRSTEELLELLKAKPNRLVWGKPSAREREAAAEKVKAAREAQGAAK